jgi:hypothetical protein
MKIRPFRASNRQPLTRYQKAHEDSVTLPLGKIYASIGTIAVFAEAPADEPDAYLTRHANGDWGDVDDHDRKANKYAVEYRVTI